MAGVEVGGAADTNSTTGLALGELVDGSGPGSADASVLGPFRACGHAVPLDGLSTEPELEWGRVEGGVGESDWFADACRES